MSRRGIPMKRLLQSAFLMAGLAVLLFATSGCYTRIAVRETYESGDDRYNYPEYSETYRDSGGTVINNYYGMYPRSSLYFHYYYPTRWSYMWHVYYDPWYWDPWWGFYDPWYGGYWGPVVSGWCCYPLYYPYVHYPYHRYWDRYYSLPATRLRTFGVTRTRDGFGTAPGTIPTLIPASRETGVTRSRTGSVYDRISTRNRDRDNTGGSTMDATRTRERVETNVPSGTLQPGGSTAPSGTSTRDRITTPPAGSSSRERSYTPPSNQRSRDRSSPPPSDTRSRDRSSYSPPPQSSPPPSGGGSHGGSSGSSSRESSSGSSGRSRTR
ncbi:MAG: hypothetical protein QHI48_00560 [Bacteroidota bacterium]|nr:hypothetical protein [Bacteroidota bacterium]